ncbi:UNVERIFIED_CONTAM: hypothetical protein GTU68_021416 [Idotea baltica]|nr:hypothetical protein [Idotea baltica]
MLCLRKSKMMLSLMFDEATLTTPKTKDLAVQLKHSALRSAVHSVCRLMRIWRKRPAIFQTLMCWPVIGLNVYDVLPSQATGSD